MKHATTNSAPGDRLLRYLIDYGSRSVLRDAWLAGEIEHAFDTEKVGPALGTDAAGASTLFAFLQAGGFIKLRRYRGFVMVALRLPAVSHEHELCGQA